MDGLRVTEDVVIPDDELSWRFSRSSGPGGQYVNTTDSRVDLRWNVETSVALPPDLRARVQNRLAGRLVDGSIVIFASKYRSQHRNREAAKERLAELVRTAMAPPPPPRRPTRPTRAARARRVDTKRQRGEVKRLRRSIDE
jgi:ribosome-associated protein